MDIFQIFYDNKNDENAVPEVCNLMDNKGFDLWADGYDKSVELSEKSNEYPFAGYKDVLNFVYNIVKSKVGSLLDIGFGTGVLTKRLYDDGYVITGVDFSQRMIEIAKDKMPNANLLCHDFTKGLPDKLKDESYDWIISTYAIHHLTDGEKIGFITELLNHLNPNGTIIFGDVAFETREGLEQVRKEYIDIWDEDEFYLVAEEIQERLSDVKVEFKEISYCAGVMIIRE